MADFIGETNLLPGTFVAKSDKLLNVFIEGVSFTFDQKQDFKAEGEVFISIRPEQVNIKRQRSEGIGRVRTSLGQLNMFGPKKLPELGRAVGHSLKEFKNATRQ